MKTKFWTFSQNNTGGSFDFDEAAGITNFVVVEANDADDAKERAEKIGLYWNGCDDGRDCPCCGDRWSEPWGDGEVEPMIYSSRPSDYDSGAFAIRWMKPAREICVHHIDGRKEWF